MTPESADQDPTLYVAAHARGTPEFDGRLRVVSWNIRFGEEIDAAVGVLRTSEALRDLDLLLLQEMDEEGVDAIASSLGHNYVYGAATVHSRTGKNFGNAVLSPWPLSEVMRVSLPRGSRLRGGNRVVVRATARIGESFVQAYSVHTETVTLPWKQRVQQFRRLAAHASSWMGDHVVVAGDFNTASRRGVGVLTELMAGIDLERVSAGAGPTFRRASMSWPLDHIFARGMPVIDTGVVEGAEGSDHFPLWARLTMT
jgi:endonuclease/exonuclease/phosphatase family metal-dependent hydrolase